MSAENNGYSVIPVQGVMLPLRILQLIFGLGVLGISAYHLSLVVPYGITYDAGGLGVFTGIATLIFVVYWFVANGVTKLYNYWAIFSVELFILIFWLCTFALIADKVATVVSADNIYDSYGSGGDGSDPYGDGSSGTYCYAGYCAHYKRSLSTDPFSATLYAVLAFSVINFILFGVTFIIYTVNLFRHRAALSAQSNNTHAQTNQLEKGRIY